MAASERDWFGKETSASEAARLVLEPDDRSACLWRVRDLAPEGRFAFDLLQSDPHLSVESFHGDNDGSPADASPPKLLRVARRRARGSGRDRG